MILNLYYATFLLTSFIIYCGCGNKKTQTASLSICVLIASTLLTGLSVPDQVRHSQDFVLIQILREQNRAIRTLIIKEPDTIMGEYRSCRGEAP